MLRAFAVKVVALIACLVAVWALPAGVAVAVVIAIASATVAFFAFAIVHPRSQFFGPVVHRLATAEPAVALTFDDGPDPVVTPRVLDLLAAHGARASFFVLGERAARHPELIRRIHREGHSVGTHTQRHLVRFHFGSPRFVQREIEDAVAVVAAILPGRPRLFRPPQGLRTPCFASGWRRTRGLTCVTWTARGRDSFATTADAIVARIAPHLRAGAIIALHDGTGLGGGLDRAPTLAALATLLDECTARGLRCIALDDEGTPGAERPPAGAADASVGPALGPWSSSAVP